MGEKIEDVFESDLDANNQSLIPQTRETISNTTNEDECGPPQSQQGEDEALVSEEKCILIQPKLAPRTLSIGTKLGAGRVFYERKLFMSSQSQ